jgi:general secretion pathway protein A
MYTEFYNLREEPFSITADPEFFFSSSRHKEAVGHLEFGIQNRRGIIVVTGEIGTGKTTLCRTLLGRLDNTVKTALVLNPDFSNLQLLQLILKDFGIEPRPRNKFALIDALNAFLIEETNRGNNVALIIDESQNLTVRQLEQIRLLSNLETEKHKLLQIILVGQPELLTKLRLNSLRQLNQRVGVRYHILPLERPEVSDYIEHRLKIASAGDPHPKIIFSSDAVDAVFELSKGTPRLINLLCDRALLAGFVAETSTIDKKIIYKAAREVI